MNLKVHDDPFGSQSMAGSWDSASHLDSIFGLGILVPMAGVALLPAPIWLQTTLIGSVWAALVLVGLTCAWSRYRFESGIASFLIVLIAHRSMLRLTDLEPYACWFVVVSLLAGGWILGLLFARQLATTPIPLDSSTKETCALAVIQKSRPAICSIWDIGCLTTLVAMASWILPRIESQLDLICHLAPAVLGGLILSGLAVQWARYDRWTFSGLASMGLGLIAAAWVCLWAAPSEMGTRGLLIWMLIGPASVVATQATIVLAYLAAIGRSGERD